MEIFYLLIVVQSVVLLSQYFDTKYSMRVCCCLRKSSETWKWRDISISQTNSSQQTVCIHRANYRTQFKKNAIIKNTQSLIRNGKLTVCLFSSLESISSQKNTVAETENSSLSNCEFRWHFLVFNIISNILYHIDSSFCRRKKMHGWTCWEMESWAWDQCESTFHFISWNCGMRLNFVEYEER